MQGIRGEDLGNAIRYQTARHTSASPRWSSSRRTRTTA
jgi:hypothetical protein